MNLRPFPARTGSTGPRRRFWDDARTIVIASQKIAGKNVSVDEHIGKGTVINVDRDQSAQTATGACCVGNVCTPDLTESDCISGGGTYQGDGTDCTDNPCVCPAAGITSVTVTFSGILACACYGSGSLSYLGTDLGGLNASFVLPRINSTTFRLVSSPLFRVTKWSPNTDCTGTIEFEHESTCWVQASCNSTTNRWTVAIQEQVDSFFAFFGRGHAGTSIAAEGVCGDGTDLFSAGSAVISF